MICKLDIFQNQSEVKVVASPCLFVVFILFTMSTCNGDDTCCVVMMVMMISNNEEYFMVMNDDADDVIAFVLFSAAAFPRKRE